MEYSIAVRNGVLLGTLFSRFSFSYLKLVDKFNDMSVSAFVTGGYIKFMLLHDGKNEDTIRQFFNELYELYVKVCSHFRARCYFKHVCACLQSCPSFVLV